MPNYAKPTYVMAHRVRSLTVLALAALLHAVPVAEAGESFAIDSTTIALKTGRIVLNQVNVTGSSLSKADFEALLKSDLSATTADKLKAFDAETLTVKSAEVSIDEPLQTSKTVYSDIAAHAIAAGIAGTLNFETAKQSATIRIAVKPPQATTATTGRTVIERPNIGGMIAWMTTSDATGTAPMLDLYGRATIDSMQILSADGTFDIGKMTGSGFKARLLKSPLTETNALLLAPPPAGKTDKPDPRTFAALVDIYDAFQFGEGAVEFVRFQGKDAASRPITFETGPISYRGGEDAQGKMTNLNFKAHDGYLRLKSLAIVGDPYAMALGGIADAVAKSSGAAAAAPQPPAPPRDLAIRLEGLDLDLPAAKSQPLDAPPMPPAGAAQRIALKIERLNMEAGRFLSSVPTRLAYGIEHLQLKVDEQIMGPQAKALRDAGIDTLDVSFKTSGDWDQKTSRLSLTELSLDIDKLASINLTGDFGNIPKDVFTAPESAAALAMMTATIETAALRVTDRGAFDKLLAAVAKRNGQPVNELKKTLTVTAPVLLAAYLADHPDVDVVAAAVNNFIVNPGTLEIKLKSASGSGVNLLEAMAGFNAPALLLSKFRFEAANK